MSLFMCKYIIHISFKALLFAVISGHTCEMIPTADIHPHSELNVPEAPPTARQLIIGGAHLHSQRGGYIFKFNFFPAL